jgi:antitoxin VapB
LILAITKTQYIVAKITYGRHGNIVRVNGICAEGTSPINVILSVIYIVVYTNHIRRCHIMVNAKIFENGRSQAVRLPKEYRFTGDEVAANKVGEVVILMPKDNPWSGFLNSFDFFSDDFMKEGRGQGEVQERETL